jgi:hypothetical protein
MSCIRFNFSTEYSCVPHMVQGDEFLQLTKATCVGVEYSPRVYQKCGSAKQEIEGYPAYISTIYLIKLIVILAEPHSGNITLAILLMSTTTILRPLRLIHSILLVPAYSETPIRTLYLSFREFILSDKLRQEPFRVNGAVTHRTLSIRCLQLLSTAE